MACKKLSETRWVIYEPFYAVATTKVEIDDTLIIENAHATVSRFTGGENGFAITCANPGEFVEYATLVMLIGVDPYTIIDELPDDIKRLL